MTLTGTGAAAGINVSPSSITFGSQTLNQTTAAQTVSIANSGNAALTVSGISISGASAGDFAQSNNCGSSIAAGASCTISVSFTPSASGSRTASISIANSVSTQTVSLAGTGAGASSGLSLSTSSVTFTNEPIGVASATETVTITNNSGSSVSVSSLAVAGADAADFSQNNTCGSSLAAGANCTVALLFTPSALGQRTASLNVSDSASTSAQTVSLAGAGGHDVVLSWTASPSGGVIGYNIYRGTTSGGESATPLNSSPLSGTEFTDENVTAGTEYFYTVTAATSGSQSAASSETSATVPTP